MNHIEQYSDGGLQEMQEICTNLCIALHFPGKTYTHLKEIHRIALVEINRELDERKLRKAGAK